jgi:serine/threonine protein kinase/Tol biopolymer transport system component
MSLPVGTKLGPYEIVAAIGAGGMGEVYRARDTRLGRDVAIKVLPESLAKDADRLRRFEQEARAVAALNHPNILAIHDIGTQNGAPFLVSELLDGETLRQKIEAGPLPAKRAIEYSLGIAHGLAAAHDKGIVHRDLKPENVIITRDGRAKVLDFGLAKLVRPEENTEIANTLTSPGTLPGVTMGTIGYMSPEQVRGTPSDARSDIFSFGTVLYEMLTGKRAFKRDTAAESMTAILREEPAELNDPGWRGPIALQRILGRCLEKNVEQRFQSASDLAFAIEALSGTGTAAVPTMEAAPSKKIWWPWLAAAAAALALAAGMWLLGRHSFSNAPPKYTRLTYQQGFLSAARFAKGAQTVVYSAQWGASPMQIYTVRLEFPQSSKVDLPSATLLALSQSDDLQINVDPVFHTNFISGTLAQALISGGTPRSQANDVIASDFAPDGKTSALSRLANQRVQLEFPAGKVLYTTSGYLDYVRVAPNGKSVAFLEHPVFDDDRGWVATIDDAGHHQLLTKEFSTVQGLAWSPDGNEIWFTGNDTADRQLYAVTPRGKQRLILAIPQGLRLMDTAPDGRVLLCGEELRTEIAGIDPATRKERSGLEWFNGSGLSDLSPDGKALLFSEWGGPAGALYLVVYRKLDGSAPVSLGEGGTPKFSPDGKFAASPVLSRPPQVALHPIGTGSSRLLPVGDIATLTAVAWFPDGQHLLMNASKEGQSLRTYVMDLQGGKPEQLGPADFTGIAVAKGGKKIAGRNGAGEAIVFDQDTQKMQPIPGIGPQDAFEAWTADGQALIVTTSTPWEAQIYRLEVTTGKKTLLQKLELTDKAGSTFRLRAFYAEQSKTYAYNSRRVLDSLYVVEGLQ